MSKVLVLGAGFVAGPFLRAMLERDEVRVRIGDLEPDKAAVLAGSHPRASFFGLDLRDEAALDAEIASADVVASLVPYAFHPVVARACLRRGKNMVTASYASDAMRALDGEARKAGITILNEMGLDPGIDHMEAMRLIHGVQASGGTVLGFTSYCGGLPSPEANNNPFGYKFSWSPRGVLLAGTNDARYLKDGREIHVPGAVLFDHYELLDVPGLGLFEAYPNRNSLPYLGIYGIPGARTMYRGTFRYPGWCRTMKAIAALGYLSQEDRLLAGWSARDLILALAEAPAGTEPRAAAAARLKMDRGSDVFDRMAWLGLFDDVSIGVEHASPLEALERLMLRRLRYEPGERDMILLQHVIDARTEKGREIRITSTLVDRGIPGGDSSMSRTVGLPAAAGARLLLDGRLAGRGVVIPVWPEIYEPVLADLARRGIAFREERQERTAGPAR
ncbi:MAG: saccharopine dehydrogenase C-terminal domain-containing protein [Acidobacteriota bacterium]|nr:saccharopine dehydrogenase C-terminal domain-containing protein [Acidobacteriota bacterium]